MLRAAFLPIIKSMMKASNRFVCSAVLTLSIDKKGSAKKPMSLKSAQMLSVMSGASSSTGRRHSLACNLP